MLVTSCTKDLDHESLAEVEALMRSTSSILTQMPQNEISSITSGFNPNCPNPTLTLGSVINDNGVLKFSDLTHFENCVQCLEDLLENHLSGFENTYINASAEELDSIAEAIGFDYFDPLVIFENSLNFTSRRSVIEDQIVSWLDQDSLSFDWNDDPDELDDFSEEERTLMSDQGLVKIGQNIINVFEMDNYYSNQAMMMGCFFSDKTKDYFYPSNNRRVKVKLKNTSYPWKAKIKSKIVHYKKKRGKWRRRRADLRAQCSGVITLSDCTPAAEHGNVKNWKKRRSRKAKSVIWGSESWNKHQDNNQWGNLCVYNNWTCYTLNH